MIKMNNQKLMQQYEIDYQQVAKEILDSRSKKNSDIAAEALKNRSNGLESKIKINTQSEFLQSLKGSTYNKLQMQILDAEKMQDKDKKDITKNVEKQGKSLGNQAGKSIDKTVENSLKAKNAKLGNIMDKKQIKQESESLKSDILKSIYEDSMERYYHMKLDVQKQLANKGKLVASDKVYGEYLEYQNYLRKIDLVYKKQNGRYIALDDPEIKKKEQTMLRYSMQGEYKTQEDVGNAITSYKAIQDSIEDINANIAKLAKDYDNDKISQPQYEKKLDEYQSHLISKEDELEKVRPSEKEIEEYNQKMEKQQDAEDRVLGGSYNKYVAKKGIRDINSKAIDIGREKSENTYYDERIESLESREKALNSQIKAEEDRDESQDNIDESKNVRKKSDFDEMLKENVEPKEDVAEKDAENLKKLKQESKQVSIELDNTEKEAKSR